MSERIVNDRVDPRSPTAVPPAGEIVQLGSNVLRFDGAESAPPPVADKARQLSNFSQFVQDIQAQLGELDQREQQLTQRETEIEQTERHFRLWVSETEAELSDRKELLKSHEAALAERMAQFDRQVRELEAARDQLDAEREFLAQQRANLRHEMQIELQRERDVLAEEHRTLNLQQAKVQELGDALLEQHQSLQTRMEEQLRQEREQLWISLNAEWEQQRAKFQQEQAEFLKDRTLLENRLRFQQEHLDKTRAELERNQQNLVREQQLVRNRLEAAERQSHARKLQLDRYRFALDELDRALERERDLVIRMKEAMASSATKDHEQYLIERRNWEHERSHQQAELRRQQEVLLSHTEQLETRRLRMEALRREIEETSHATIELRFAVEDVWSQLQQALGLSVTEEKVDQARQAVASDFEHWQARLAEQRQELFVAERELERQRLEFQEERRTLTEWLSARDRELSQKEQLLQQTLSEQTTQETVRQEVQERWLCDIDQAEQRIRTLLRNLVDDSAKLLETDASALAGDA